MRQLEQYVRGSQLPDLKPKRPALLRPSSIPARTASGGLGSSRGEAQTPFDNFVPAGDAEVGNGSATVLTVLDTGATSNKLSGNGAFPSVVAQLPVKSTQLRFGQVQLARVHFEGANLAGVRLLPPLDEVVSGPRIFECRVVITFGEKFLDFRPIETSLHHSMAVFYMTGRIVSPGAFARPTINSRFVHNYGSSNWLNLQQAISEKSLPGFNSEKYSSGRFVNDSFLAASYRASDDVFTSGLIVDILYDEMTGRAHFPNLNFI